MRYKLLGRCGLRVSELCLGTMTLGEDWGWGSSKEESRAIFDAYAEAGGIGRSPAQVALNWVRSKPGVMIPIVGARDVRQLKDNIGCLDFRLSEEQMKELDEISAVELGFPHDFLQSEVPRDLVYGGTFEQIDDHRGGTKR